MLERIVIAILLLLNLFLLFVVFSDEVESKRSERETIQSIETVFQENGIAIEDKANLIQAAPSRCVLTRSVPKETEKIAKLFSGSATTEELGGNIMFYRAETGQAVLRGNGELDVLFSGSAFPTRGNAEKTAKRVLEKIGLEAESKPISGLAEENHLEYYCCFNGYPVFNAVLSFDYAGDSLYMMTGTRVFDTVKLEESEGLIDSLSILLRFVELEKTEGFICSRVENIRAGYIMSVTVSGESSLTPVWRIETDTGIVLINAVTGGVEALTA